MFGHSNGLSPHCQGFPAFLDTLSLRDGQKHDQERGSTRSGGPIAGPVTGRHYGPAARGVPPVAGANASNAIRSTAAGWQRREIPSIPPPPPHLHAPGSPSTWLPESLHPSKSYSEASAVSPERRPGVAARRRSSLGIASLHAKAPGKPVRELWQTCLHLARQRLASDDEPP